MNNNHGHEFEPNEDSEEAVQGNIWGGKEKKILGKLIIEKEEKWFDVVECHLKDNTIEYLNSFPLGFAPMKDFLVSMDRFKRAPLKIVYHPLLKAHVNKI